MIIVHDHLGRITHSIQDPVPEETRAALITNESLFIEVEAPPVPGKYVDPKGDEYVVNRPGVIRVDHQTQYVANGELTTRPSFGFPAEIMLIADGKNSYTFEDLPANTTLYRDNLASSISDGELTITSTVPYAYELKFEAFPYLTKTVKVTTHAA